jgi:hypothetical protein
VGIGVCIGVYIGVCIGVGIDGVSTVNVVNSKFFIFLHLFVSGFFTVPSGQRLLIFLHLFVTGFLTVPSGHRFLIFIYNKEKKNV